MINTDSWFHTPFINNLSVSHRMKLGK